MGQSKATGNLTAWNPALQAKEHEKNIRDRRIKYASDVYGFASAYDNAVIIAGYAAFFALWTGVFDDVTVACRLATVAMMGSSLVLYIGWQMLQMIMRQKFEFERAATFEFESEIERFNKAWEDIDRRQGIAMMRIMKWWPVIFVPSVVLGFSGGILLTYNSFAKLLGWWELTG
jgi:hypothetical protein